MNKIILFAIALTLLSACSSSPNGTVLGEWKLVSYGDKVNPTPALPDVDTSIKFEDGRVSGNVGCNNFGGEYGLKGDAITFGGIMATEMYCEKTSAQEQGVLGVFSSGKVTVQWDGSLLTLTSADGQVVILAVSGTGS